MLRRSGWQWLELGTILELLPFQRVERSPNHNLGLGGGSSRAVTTSLNPTRLWDPSQKGLFADCPQRHNEMTVRPASPKGAPFGSRISNSPSTRIDPLVFTVIFVDIHSLYRMRGWHPDMLRQSPAPAESFAFNSARSARRINASSSDSWGSTLFTSWRKKLVRSRKSDESCCSSRVFNRQITARVPLTAGESTRTLLESTSRQH
jgi:hypothetical protein